MKVILLQDIPSQGKKYDVKEVRGGFARNFLLPRKLAMLATAAAVKEIGARRADEERRREAEKKSHEALIERLRKTPLSFTLKMTEAGSAFGSVSASDIHAGLAEKGIALEKSWIALEDPIKTGGEHAVPVDFPHGVRGEIRVVVEAG